MAPIRLKLTMELARAFGLFQLDGVSAEVAGGRWLLSGGGGYEHVHVGLRLDLPDMRGPLTGQFGTNVPAGLSGRT